MISFSTELQIQNQGEACEVVMKVISHPVLFAAIVLAKSQ